MLPIPWGRQGGCYAIVMARRLFYIGDGGVAIPGFKLGVGGSPLGGENSF